MRALVHGDKVTVIDRYGRVLFTVDKWIYEEAVQRGEIEAPVLISSANHL